MSESSTHVPALAAIINSVNIIRSFVECSGGDIYMLRVVSQLENMACGAAAHYRAKKSCISDYFK